MNDGMRPDVLAEVVSRLKSEFQMREAGEWLRRGKCPSCGSKELFINAKRPFVLRCGRENNCGWSATMRELFPDAFGRFNERFPATTADPNATADAYMSAVRGFPLSQIRGWYRQGRFSHPHGDRSTATVVFDIDRSSGILMERLIETVRVREADGEIKERKANFEGLHKGLWWMPPGAAPAGEIWIVEGCIDAIALTLSGLTAAATLSAVNFPDKALAALDPAKVTLVWALDNDKAGNRYTHKHVQAARGLGFECRAAVIPQKGKQKTDWNDAWKADELTPEDLDAYRFHGDLLLAESAAEKGVLIWARTKANSFAVEHRSQTYWFFLPQELYAKQLEDIRDSGSVEHPRGPEFQAALKAARIEKIANCAFRFLYFQQNEVTDESWYYTRIDFPYARHGGIKNTFTGGQVATGSEFKKRLLSIAPGALYTGNSSQLNWIIGKYLDDIKIVETVDFIGYSRPHKAWLFPTKAVSGGRVFDLNDEDFFEIDKLSVKSLSISLPLLIGQRRDYEADWLNFVYRAFGPKGVVAAAFFLGSLFAEQIRERHKSYPFLEIVGEGSAGKSTLIEFLWKLLGRNDYEGFDPNKSTMAARSRIMSQVSNMPVCMIESDRGGDDKAKVRQFDWDELKTAYNGRASRATGVKNGGNDTREPPFKGAILISQNATVNASEPILQRIVHLRFTTASHTADSKLAADAMAALPVEKLSWFLLAATMGEGPILDLFHQRALAYEAMLSKRPEIRHFRIAKNHGQMMALVDCLATLIKIPEDWRTAAHQCLIEAAGDRQKAIAADHPVIEEFWEVYDFLEDKGLNHARDPNLIAISLPHVQRVAAQNGQTLPAMLDLKRQLRESRSRPFVANRAVASAADGFGGKTVKCWVFRRPANA